uniref:RNA-directed RNA polymerase n=1 Tax=Blatta orientalis aliusvirus 1 TaxID=3133477 RepID=A0AAT9JPX4_9VIRU
MPWASAKDRGSNGPLAVHFGTAMLMVVSASVIWMYLLVTILHLVGPLTGGAKPSTRKPIDSRAFQVEEKFDTWLDLSGLDAFRQACQNKETWSTTWMKAYNREVCAETVCELTQLGIRPQHVGYSIVTPCLPAKILHTVITRGCTSCHMRRSAFRQYLGLSQQAAAASVRMQFGHLYSHTSPTLAESYDQDNLTWQSKIMHLPATIVSMWHFNEDMLKVFSIHRDLCKFIDDKSMKRRVAARIASTSAQCYLRSIDASITISRDISIMQWGGQTYLLSKDLLLELINKSSECLCTMTYAWMQDDTSHPAGHYDSTLAFLRHIFHQVKRHQASNAISFFPKKDNRGFTYLKSIEGLGAAYMIYVLDYELGWMNTTLIENLWGALREESLAPSYHFYESELNQLFRSISIPQVADLLGTVKLAGHPTIEVQEGLQQLYDRTHAEININPDAIARSNAILVRDLLKNYYLQYKKYPILDLAQLRHDSSLHILIRRNIDPNSQQGILMFRQATYMDWNSIVICKNAEFDPVDNQLVLLKDKALGFRRNKIWPFLVGTISADKEKEQLRLQDRRSLLSFLLSPDYSQSFRDYMARYQYDDPWTTAVLDYLVIKLTPKEKEFKTGGRMFGASPQEERNRRIVQEMNTMRFMDAYSPDQLLTPNELTTVRKLVSFRYFGQMYPNHTMFQVSFDFSKWNNNFRSASVAPTGYNILDRWFGTQLWGRTMQAFENALVYYKDKYYSRFWDGQLGGIEGLNQATWSYVFMGGVKSALEQIGAIYQLTVKGDDVRAAIAVPNIQVAQEGFEGMKNRILLQLQRLCTDMGWDLNPNETFVSLSIIATSKQYQANDTWLPASMKKVMKMMSHSNLVFPTLEDTIASVFSCAHSACSQTTVVMPAFVSACLIACRELYREVSNHRQGERISYQQLAMMSLWPQILGGPGPLPLQTFFVRGENDLLSVSLSLFRYITLHEDETMAGLAYNILSQPLEGTPDYHQLIADPYSICISAPERPKSVLKRLMRASMKDWVKNAELRCLLSHEADNDRRLLIEHLLSMRPYCAKVATVLWECSPFYIIEEVLSKFMQSSSVFSFLRQGRRRQQSNTLAYRRLAMVLNAAEMRMRHWNAVLTRVPSVPESIWGVRLELWTNASRCTTELVHIVRAHCWGRELVGITYPSLVDQNWIYHEHDVQSEHPIRPVRLGATQLLNPIAEMRFQVDVRSHHYCSIPGLVPWVGSMTSNMIELPKQTTKIRSPTLSKIMKLIALRRSGDYLGAQFQGTVTKLIQSLTNISLDAVVTITPEAGGGHLPHRAAINSYSLTTMPNYRPNIAQITRVNTEGMFILHGDSRDRTINFAARHFFNVAMATLPLQTHAMLPLTHPLTTMSVLHWVPGEVQDYVLCPWCCHIIEDVPIRFNIHFPSDLDHYNKLKLVGASAYEEQILRENIAATIMGKAKRMLQNQQLDANDPVVTEMAAAIVLRSMNSNARRIFESCRGANFGRIPVGHMSEIMAVVLGHKSIKTMSVGLLRALSPRDLYMSLFNEMLYAVTDVFAGHDVPLHVSVAYTFRYLNPLETIFRNIITAGVLSRVTEGHAMVVEQDGLPLPPLTWIAGTTTDGHRASKHFLSHHVPLIEAWLKGRAPLAKLTLCSNMQDDDTLKDMLRRMAVRVQRLVLMRLLHMQPDRSLWWPILRLLRRVAVRHNIQAPDNYNWVRAGIPPHADLAQIPELLAQETTELMLADDDDVWLSSLAKLALYLDIDVVASPRDIPELIEIASGVLSREYRLIDFEYPPFSPWRDDVMDTASWSDHALRTRVHPSIIRVTKDYLAGPCAHNHIMTQMIYEACTPILLALRTSVDFANSVRFGLMTDEDAERVVKQTPVDIAEWLAERDVHIRMGSVDDAPRLDLPVNRCAINRGGVDHRVTAAAGLPVGMVYYGDQAVAARYTQVCEEYNDAQEDDRRLFLDWADVYRCGGRLNTSICKFADIYDKTQCLQRINEYEDPCCIICFADGIGGVAAHALRNTRNATIIYNSLQQDPYTGRVPSDASVENPPVEFMAPWVTHEHRRRMRWKGFYPGDLRLRTVTQMYGKEAHRSGDLLLVTCDVDVQWALGLPQHMLILFNVLEVIIQQLHADGYAIIKFFLTNDPWCDIMLRFCATNFNHFHLYHSPITRSHSLEVFLIMSGVKNRNLAHHHLSILRREARTYHVDLEIDAMIHDRVQAIVGHVVPYRQHGVTPPTYEMHDVWAMYYRMNVRPLYLPHLLQRFETDTWPGVRHFCRSVTELRDLADRRIQSAVAVLRSLSARQEIPRRPGIRRPKVVTGARSAALAHGWTIDENWVKDYIHYLVVYHLLDPLYQRVTRNVLLEWDILYDRITMDLQGLIHEQLLDIELEQDDQMHIWCQRPNARWNVTRHLRNVAMRVLRLIGTLCYINWLIENEPRACRSYIREWSPGCEMEPCCAANAALVNRATVGVTLPGGAVPIVPDYDAAEGW